MDLLELDDMKDVNPFYDKEEEEDEDLFDIINTNNNFIYGDETTTADTGIQDVSTPTMQSKRKLWFESPSPPPKEEEEDEFEFHQAVAQLQEHLNTMVAANAAAYSLSRFVPLTLRGLLTRAFASPKQNEGEEDEDIKTIKLAWNTLVLQVRTANTVVEVNKCVPVLHAFAALCLHDCELVQKMDTTDDEVAQFIVATWERWFDKDAEEGELCSGLLDVVRGLHLKEFIAKSTKLVVPPTMLRELYSKRWHDTPPAHKVKRQRSTV